MKELIEKLIGRLEERIEENYGWEEDDFFDGQSNAFGWTIDIINELAEEYSADTPQKSAAGWIACSERLPKEKGEYLVTLKTGVVTSAIYDLNENKWVDAMEEYFEYHCIAWQPLPQPYKPQKLEWKDKVMKHFTKTE